MSSRRDLAPARSRPPRSPAAAVLRLAWIAALTALPVAALDDEADTRRARERMVGALIQLDQRSARSPQAAADLVPGTPIEVAVLFQVVDEGAVPAEWGTGAGPLEPWRREVGLGALARAPRGSLVGFLGTLVGEPYRAGARSTALVVLERTGRGRDLGLATQLAAPPELDRPVPRAVRTAFREAVAAIAQRDRLGAWDLAELFPSTHEGLLASLVEEIEQREPEEALRALGAVLDRSPALDLVVLRSMGGVADRMGRSADLDVQQLVRDLLRADDPRILRAASFTAGKLGDYEAIPDLLTLLRNEDREVRRSAHTGLMAITGLRMRADRGRWQLWYDREVVWWQEEAGQLFDVMAAGDEAQASRAVQAVARKRLFRREIAHALTNVLDRTEPELVTQACAALRHLGSPVAVPELINCLEHSDGSVRRVAWDALRHLTGDDLPLDPTTWRDKHGSQ